MLHSGKPWTVNFKARHKETDLFDRFVWTENKCTLFFAGGGSAPARDHLKGFSFHHELIVLDLKDP